MEKPILFNTEMVKAILEGRKTQTRRALKNIRAYHYDGTPGNMPPCKPGDVLYVRETWAMILNEYVYKCDYYDGADGIQDGLKLIEPKWKPSIHMPREAARLFLKVKSVRVDRLQNITDEQAISEGFKGEPCDHPNMDYVHGCTDCMNSGWLVPPTFEFAELWDKTLKPVEIDRFGWAASSWARSSLSTSWIIPFPGSSYSLQTRLRGTTGRRAKRDSFLKLLCKFARN